MRKPRKQQNDLPRGLLCPRWVAVLLSLFALGVSTTLYAEDLAATVGRDLPPDMRARIQDLINDLADENYATRVNAVNHLREFGVYALDELTEASRSTDPQISSTALYLLKSGTQWIFPGDSAEIKKLMESYSSKSLPMDRLLILEKLATLPSDAGVSALARVARYEPNGDLSKQAALLLMQMEEDYLTPQQLMMRWQTIQSVIDTATNDACIWLRKCHTIFNTAITESVPPKQLHDLFSHLNLPKPLHDFDYRLPPLGTIKFELYKVGIDAALLDASFWMQHIDEQYSQLSLNSGNTSLATIEKLVEFSTEMAVRAGELKMAAQFLDKYPALDEIEEVDSQNPLRRTSFNTRDFVIRQRAMRAVDFGLPEYAVELFENNLEQTQRNLILSLDYADAVRWTGDLDKANKLYDELPSNPYSAYEFLPANYVAQRGNYAQAVKLIEKDLAKLSENDSIKVYYIYVFGHIFQEATDWQRMVDLYEPLIQRMELEEAYRKKVRDLMTQTFDNDVSVEALQSNYFFAKGMLDIENQQHTQAIENLSKSIDLNPENVDAVIEMFRLPNDEARQKELSERIDLSIEKCRADVLREKSSFESDGALGSKRYANAINTYAWLITNVNRNLDEALELSIYSNQLQRDTPAYIDTLARCYYSKGDLDNAIYWQMRAHRLDPSQHTLLRTLLQYQQEAANRKPN